MFKLRTGYFIGGIVTGLVLLFNFITTIPDGKLHVYFCDVGQGDAAYVRFPDGRDMLVDGGPNDKVLQCLGRHMPFWDRHINLVVNTHPQKDHLHGLITVLERYGADYVVRSEIVNNSDEYREFESVIARKKIPVKFVTRGETIDIGTVSLSIIWPSVDQIARMKPLVAHSYYPTSDPLSPQVLGTETLDLNDGTVVLSLRYGSFDALFPGDADTHVEANYRTDNLADDTLEVLKVPHHGSRTGISEEYIQKLHPALAIISVGKNTYGHPDKTILQQLAVVGSRVLQTDKEKDIEVMSDGNHWSVISPADK